MKVLSSLFVILFLWAGCTGSVSVREDAGEVDAAEGDASPDAAIDENDSSQQESDGEIDSADGQDADGGGDSEIDGGTDASDHATTIREVEQPFLLYIMNDWSQCAPLDLKKAGDYWEADNKLCLVGQYLGRNCTKKDTPARCNRVGSNGTVGNLYLDGTNLSLDAANALLSECACDTGRTVDKGADDLSISYPIGPFGSHKSHTGGIFWNDINTQKDQYNFLGIDDAIAQQVRNPLLIDGNSVPGNFTMTIPVYGADCRDYTPLYVYQEMCGKSYGLRYYRYHRQSAATTYYSLMCPCGPATGYASMWNEGPDNNPGADLPTLCQALEAGTQESDIVVDSTCDMPPFSNNGTWWNYLKQTIDAVGAKYQNAPALAIVQTATGTDDESACTCWGGFVKQCPDQYKFRDYVAAIVDAYSNAFPHSYIMVQITGGDMYSMLGNLQDTYTPQSHPSPKSSLQRSRVGLKGDFFADDESNQTIYHGNKDHDATFRRNNEQTDVYLDGFMDFFAQSWKQMVSGAEHGLPRYYKEAAGEYADQWNYAFYLMALQFHVIMLDTWDLMMHDRENNAFFTRHAGRSIEDTPDAWVALRETRYLCVPDSSSWYNATVLDAFVQCQNSHDYDGNCCYDVARQYIYKSWFTARGGWRGDLTFWLERPDGIAGAKTKVIPPLKVMFYDANYNLVEDRLPPNNQFPNIYAEEVPTNLWTHRYSSSMRRTDVASGNPYMYFRLDDNFPKKRSSGEGYRVAVIYIDKGTDSFSLDYQDKSGAIRTVVITKGNTMEWKEQHLDLPGAFFKNQLDGSTDFRLNALEGDEIVHMVKVINDW